MIWYYVEIHLPSKITIRPQMCGEMLSDDVIPARSSSTTMTTTTTTTLLCDMHDIAPRYL